MIRPNVRVEGDSLYQMRDRLRGGPIESPRHIRTGRLLIVLMVVCVAVIGVALHYADRIGGTAMSGPGCQRLAPWFRVQGGGSACITCAPEEGSRERSGS